MPPRKIGTQPTTCKKNDMKRTVIATGLVLVFAVAARAETTDWPPQKEKESVFTEPAL